MLALLQILHPTPSGSKGKKVFVKDLYGRRGNKNEVFVVTFPLANKNKVFVRGFCLICMVGGLTKTLFLLALQILHPTPSIKSYTLPLRGLRGKRFLSKICMVGGGQLFFFVSFSRNSFGAKQHTCMVIAHLL